MTTFLVYLCTILDPLLILFKCLIAVCIICAGVCFMECPKDENKRTDEEKKKDYCLGSRWAVASIVFLMLTILVPDTKSAVAIYTIPKLIESKTIQNLDAITIKFIEKTLGVKILELGDKR